MVHELRVPRGCQKVQSEGIPRICQTEQLDDVMILRMLPRPLATEPSLAWHVHQGSDTHLVAASDIFSIARHSHRSECSRGSGGHSAIQRGARSPACAVCRSLYFSLTYTQASSTRWETLRRH